MKGIKLFFTAVMALYGISGMAETVNLGEVAITATRIEQSIFDSPASIEVMSAKKIEQKSVQRADEALSNLAGVTVRSTGDHAPNSYNNQVTLRGIPGYYRTAVLVDDFPLNNAFSGGVNWSNIMVDDIKQIEVVKGPFSSLYGGNAMGGVINVITKDPIEREISLKMGYGSNDFKNSSLVYRDKITDKLGITLDFNHQQSDGYVNDLVTKTVSNGIGGASVIGQRISTDSTGKTVYIVGDKGKKSWWMNNVGLKFVYRPDEVSKISLGFTYHEHKNDYEGFNTYLTDSLGNPVYSGSVQLNATQKATLSEKDFLFGPTGETTKKYTLGYETKFLNDINVKVKADYTEFGYWYILQSTGATSSGGAGTYTDIPNKKTYASAQLDFPMGDMNHIVIGVDTNKNELDKTVKALSNWRDDSTTTTLNAINNGESTTNALFLQDTIDFSDQWVLYVGGRYDAWKTNGMTQSFIAPTYQLIYDTRKDSQFSPKASLVYLPSDNTTLRTSIGQAFKAPLLSDLYSSYVASNGVLYQANSDLKPEKTTSWEVGIDQRFSTKTELKATYFVNDLTNLIYSTQVSPTLNEKRNAGKAEVKGFEVEVKQGLTDDIDAFVNFTVNKSKITKNDANTALIGKKLTYMPEKQFNVGVSGKEGAWSGSVIGSYVGELYTKDDNTDTIKGVYGAYESYFTVNTKIGYQFNKYINGSIAVNNLFDREYYQYSLTPGRTVYAELGVKF